MLFARSKAAIADGTVLMSVTSFAAGKVDKCNAFSARITLPPQLSGTNSSKTDKSKQMEVENRVPLNNPGRRLVFAARAGVSGKKSSAQSISVTGLRCSIATPFGLPVEPEV